MAAGTGYPPDHGGRQPAAARPPPCV